MTEWSWRHEEIAALLGSLTIKTCGGFLEKDQAWTCPGCRRSKPHIVAPGQNVDVVACIYRHHDHIGDLISRLLNQELPHPPWNAEANRGRLAFQDELERRFCRFQPVEVCHACNNIDTVAKKIVGAPWWFSFSPRGIRNVIRSPQAYAASHEIDRDRLRVVWDQVSVEIEGLEDRVLQAIRRGWADYAAPAA